MRNFRTRYGSFSADGTEYIITTPATPRPWINVISNGDYGFTVSQTGGGYSWRTHAQLNRLTRWEQDLVKDEWGKFIYIRDEKENLWSAGWKPVCATPDSYRCRHGVGYTAIESKNFGIETVPADVRAERRAPRSVAVDAPQRLPPYQELSTSIRTLNGVSGRHPTGTGSSTSRSSRRRTMRKPRTRSTRRSGSGRCRRTGGTGTPGGRTSHSIPRV
jgi:hypothetical protein